MTNNDKQEPHFPSTIHYQMWCLLNKYLIKISVKLNITREFFLLFVCLYLNKPGFSTKLFVTNRISMDPLITTLTGKAPNKH